MLPSLDVLYVQSTVGCLVAVLDFFDYIIMGSGNKVINNKKTADYSAVFLFESYIFINIRSVLVHYMY